MEKFVFSLCLCLLPGLIFATDILIVGDSISTAYGLKRDQGWVTLLQQKLRNETHNLKIINASISGETTGGGMARIDRMLEQHRPDIVILELGGNDGLRGFSPKLIKSNLSKMIKRSQDKDAEVLLLGMRIPPNYGKRYTELFANIYSQLAKEYRISLVPFLLNGIGTRSDLMQQDGIHPNAKAQPIIMEMVLLNLKPMIEHQIQPNR